MRSFFAERGLEYAPPETIPNSRAALRVTELARDRGVHEQVHDGLMDAYWSDGRNIGDPDVLRGVAGEAGLDAADVEEVVAGDAYLERVTASTQQAQQLGITGIPGWLVGERLLLLGAQPREVFEQAVERLQTA